MFVRLNDLEMSALAELTLLQRCLYVFGIKPYMDLATGIVGKVRGISWQSLVESIYVPPQSGFIPETFSKQQLRRAAAVLEKAGLLKSISTREHLIFFCPLADKDNSAKKQVGIKPTSHADTIDYNKRNKKTNGYDHGEDVGRHSETLQADTPPLSVKDEKKNLSLAREVKRKVAGASRGSTRAKRGPSFQFSIPTDWQPSARCYELIEQSGISRAYAESLVPEFRSYWELNGEQRPGWDSTFLSHCKRSLRKGKSNGSHGKSTVQDRQRAASRAYMLNKHGIDLYPDGEEAIEGEFTRIQ